jgi:NADH-quinone oxidoreductase subunit E
METDRATAHTGKKSEPAEARAESRGEADTDFKGTREGVGRDVFASYPRSREYLIPILQEVQDRLGYLSRESICAIADYLELPESKVYGVATFYNQFKLNPPGKYQIQVCRGTACHVKGSFNLLEALKRELGIDAGMTTKDKLFSLETVACIGACSIAPVLTVNGKFHGRLDVRKVEKILKDLRAEGRNNGGKG